MCDALVPGNPRDCAEVLYSTVGDAIMRFALLKSAAGQGSTKPHRLQTAIENTEAVCSAYCKIIRNFERLKILSSSYIVITVAE